MITVLDPRRQHQYGFCSDEEAGVKRYGQYCPVARAAEVLAERGTLLVLRELLCGAEHFNDIARGVPRMSPTLLSSRLRELQRAGLVRREVVGRQSHYRLTPAGEELRPVVEQIGAWGQRWMQSLRPEELDVTLLMLDISRNLEPPRLPERAVTVHLHLPDAPVGDQRWWWVLSRGGSEVCDTDPGLPVRVWVRTDPATLTRVWLGELSWARAVRADALTLTGDADAASALPGWLGLSPFAAVPRAAVGLPR